MTKFEFGRALRAHFNASREPRGQHPAAEDLVAYRSEALGKEQERQVRDHLVICAECSELLLDLAELEDTGGLTGTVSEFEIEAAWNRQRDRILPSHLVRKRWPGQKVGWLVAACLALVAGTLGMQLRELRQASALLYAQDLPRVIVNGSKVRGLGDELPVLRFEPGKPGLLLFLLDKDLPFESFRAEFLTTNGKPLFIRDGLSASENLLLVLVKTELLTSGKIRVAVSGSRGGRFVPVEEYELQIELP